MALALAEAERARQKDEVPVGAVIVQDGQIIATAHNLVETLQDATAHAELLAIRAAMQKLGNKRLTGCELYVTLEPCTMCAGAISFARLARVTIAARDPKGGGVWHGTKFYEQPTCHHRPAIAESDAIHSDKAAAILRDFFAGKRAKPAQANA